MPCTAKVEIPWHVCERAHLPKPPRGLFILNYSISQVKLLGCMNWDHCLLQFHGIKQNSLKSERINSYVTSQCLFWALPLQIIFACVALHWMHTSLQLGCFSFQTLSINVVVLNSISRAMDMNIARVKVPTTCDRSWSHCRVQIWQWMGFENLCRMETWILYWNMGKFCWGNSYQE